MTGCWFGSHAYVERALKRPLTWLICLFHQAELPIKHLIQYMDKAKTTSPEGIPNGPLGIVICGTELSIKSEFTYLYVMLG